MIINYSFFISDLLRLLKRINFYRALNLAGIYLGLFISRLWGRTLLIAAPFAVSAETASCCNLSCPECPAGLGIIQREQKLMKVALFKKLIEGHKKQAFYANLYFQGEPFLNPDLPEMITRCASEGYYSCISTNGHFLDKQNCHSVINAGLDRIVVSLDGLDQQTYSYYRKGGNLRKVAGGILNLSSCRKELKASNPLIEVQFLVNRENYHQIKSLKKYCRDLGADLITLKSMQVYGKEGAEKFLPSDSKFNRYSVMNKKKRPGRAPCYRLWSHAVYTADGVAVACCYDKMPDFQFGWLENNKPEEIWFSSGFKKFRQRVIDNRHQITICSNCDG